MIVYPFHPSRLHVLANSEQSQTGHSSLLGPTTEGIDDRVSRNLLQVPLLGVLHDVDEVYGGRSHVLILKRLGISAIVTGVITLARVERLGEVREDLNPATFTIVERELDDLSHFDRLALFVLRLQIFISLDASEEELTILPRVDFTEF